ncbi:Ig-like domain-containing protein, partial [Shewanella sp. AS16]|uniref:Ig-like domain-containing protein n=1 Tax=Shewanella sp. AS16 TaxID=2907625 RepID=UPI001F38DD28
VVFPLPRASVLPEGAVYRKYNQVQGWYDFVEDANNSISSAPLNAEGQCPQVGAAAYETGLVPGHQCVQLLLQDGGPNDADGVANGVIEDPGVVSTQVQNTAPVAVADRAEIVEGQSLVIDVLANDSDADGDALTLVEVSAGHGSAVVTADNRLEYTAEPGFSGTVTLTYRVSDGYGGMAEGVVAVTVTAAAVEPDPEPEPEPGPEADKGGSLPLWSVWLLGLLVWRRRAL